MTVTVRDPHDTQAAIKAAASSPTSGLSQSQLTADTESVIGDLNANNYAAAWNTALSTSSAYGTNYNGVTKDPLLAAMESGSGLNALDPTKQWDSTQTANYYAALGNTATFQGKQTDGSSLGKNPYGQWGSLAGLAGDAKINMSTAGDNSAPDVQRFAGAKPSQSFLSKYGGDIAALAIGAVTAGTGLGPALLAAGADAAGTAGVIGAGAALGAGTGAVGAAITGKNIGQGALMGALGGGIGTAASGLASSAFGSSGLSGAAGKIAAKAGTNLATGAIGQDIYGGAANGGSTGMMSNLGNLTAQQYASGISGLAGAGLGVATAGNIGSMQQNAYTTAGNAANQLPYNVSTGSGMGANFTNGQANINYGNLTGAQNQFAQFANQQSGFANALNGHNPYAVQQAGNTAQGAINTGMNANYVSGNSGQQLAQFGLGQINSPLVQQAQGSAQSLLGSAGANYNSAYNTSLNSQLAALNPAIQQQSNALLNSEFQRGQAGSSGGALQTQALQNSFNQADLQAQGNAVSQANALMGTTYNAANTASGIATNNQAAGTNMYNVGNNAYTSGYNNAAALGMQGNSLQQNLAAFAPQLAGMYNTNAANATQAAGNINTQGLQNAQFGLALGANQGNQMNNAARTQGSIGTAYNGGTTGALGSAFSSLGGLLQGGNSSYGGLLNSIFGTGTSAASNLFSGSAADSSIYSDTSNYLSSAGLGNVDNSSYFDSLTMPTF